ncbi:MAG: GNAT family N-acetyltransferase [Acidobacteria bacterium]|nr:GNAT family N-acetyltransferase [Acidobacteriota bacterium]
MHYRIAQPHDAAPLGAIMYIAALGDSATSGYDYSLGGSREHQESVLAQLAVTQAESWFHHRHFDLVEVDGVAAAAAAGFDRTFTDELIPASLKEVGWSNVEIEILNSKLEPIMCCFPEEPENGWTIEHVGCLPQYRRRGLTRPLIERALQRGREAGYESAHLDVFASNKPAIALYESLGFRRIAEFGDAVFQSLLNRGPMLRMQRPL